MTWLWWVLLALVVLVVVGVWLVSTADRLDRVHHRIDVARAALEAQLLHRSAVSFELAVSQRLDPARSLLLVDAAHHARAVGAEDQESAESDLSETLRAVLTDAAELAALRADETVGPLVEELAVACRKVELARRFHNDAVASAQALRSRRLVRWGGLAGRAPAPASVDLDDRAPVGLLED